MKVNPKSEIRNPKQARNPKSEPGVSGTQQERPQIDRASVFGFHSDLGFRISDFHRRGFTLLELILAVAIMAIVLAAINAVFFSALRLREHTAAAVDASLPLEHSLTVMRRDLAGAMAPSTEGILSGSFRVGGVSTLGLGEPVDIELYTTTGALRADQPWSEIQKVTYALRQPANRSQPGRDLIRSVTRNLLSTLTPQPQDQWMMGGVETIEFSCFDGAQWRTYWDTTLTDTNLPTAIRVRLQLAGADPAQPVEMVVPLDAQSRTNQTALNGS